MHRILPFKNELKPWKLCCHIKLSEERQSSDERNKEKYATEKNLTERLKAEKKCPLFFLLH